MQIIPTADHVHNSDPSARIVWEDRNSLDTVYRVAAGYVATLGRVGAYDVKFATQAEAVAAVQSFRSRISVQPMYAMEG